MNASTTHLWLVGARRADRDEIATRLAEPEIRVDCHRRLRGPYSGTGTLLRALVPDVHARRRELVDRHAVEILTIAPELQALIDPPFETLTALAIPKERTRFYAPARTRRLAHGIVELLKDWSHHRGTGPLRIAFGNVGEADPTDQELIAILLRRAAPGSVQVLVGTSEDELPPELRLALDTYAQRIDVQRVVSLDEADRRNLAMLARAYVASDCTSDVPEEREAYERADPGFRAALHDVRAEVLSGKDEWTLQLGAIPYHLEHGSDREAATKTFTSAIEYCLNMGFYPAIIELGMRARAIIDPESDPERYSNVSTKVTTALATLGRGDEAEQIYVELRGRYTSPAVHMFSSYALAMLYTRFHSADHKDHEQARAYVNTAIAFASQVADPADRAFQTVFNQNGLALVEMHLGNLERSLHLVTEGLERLDRELGPGEHRLHRSVLLHNRGQVHAGLGHLDQALADFSAVIELDPNYAEYYFDRGNLRHRMGDDAGALADYEHAMRLTPPFPELSYNKANVLRSMGDPEGATVAFSYVLELEPDHVDARTNRATLLLEGGQTEAALADVERGLALDPGNAHLLCTSGLIAMELGDPERARDHFTRALEADPSLHAALSNRAIVAHEQGRNEDAIDDLTRALELVGDDPDLLFNRGYVHQATGRWHRAVSDYTRALELPGADRESLLHHRGICLVEAGKAADARSDFERYLGLGSGPDAAEVRERLAALTDV